MSITRAMLTIFLYVCMMNVCRIAGAQSVDERLEQMRVKTQIQQRFRTKEQVDIRGGQSRLNKNSVEKIRHFRQDTQSTQSVMDRVKDNIRRAKVTASEAVVRFKTFLGDQSTGGAKSDIRIKIRETKEKVREAKQKVRNSEQNLRGARQDARQRNSEVKARSQMMVQKQKDFLRDNR